MHSKNSSLVKSAVLAAGGLALLTTQAAVFAHGESVRGGGSGSISSVGANITEDVSFGVRWDARRYETFTDQELVDFKQQREDVHMHSKEDAYFISLGLPVTEDIDLTLMTQYNNFKGFKDNGDAFANECFQNNGFIVDCISSTKESPGWGDTLLLGRYRFYNDGTHQWAGILGLLMPTGKITNKTDNGEILGTHNQPGSGAYTVQFGTAYSGHLSEKLAVDADWIYRVNGPGANNFRGGNSWQADVAVSYDHHSRFTPVLELNGIFFKKDVENDETKKNSGGDVIYLSPGLNMDVTRSVGLYGNFSYPIYQNLGGISNDEKYRWSLGVTYTMGQGRTMHGHDE